MILDRAHGWVAKMEAPGYFGWDTHVRTSQPFSLSQSAIPNTVCSMKFLFKFYFADWRFLVFCRNNFLQFEMTEISAGN